MPERAGLPVVVTIHDCTFFDHPEWHERSQGRASSAGPSGWRPAGRPPSSASARPRPSGWRWSARWTPRWSWRPTAWTTPGSRPTEPAAGDGRGGPRRLGLDPDRPLVVFVGTLEPRKDVADLVRAFDRVAGSHPDAVLVLAGQSGWGADDVGRALAAARHADRVVRTGYVPDDAVPALLRRARRGRLPVAATRATGCRPSRPWPAGAPLVTTSGTAMAEMAGDAARPGATGRRRPAGRGPRRRPRRPGVVDVVGAAPPAGLQIAAGRTWAASAEAHLVAYRQAAASPPARRPLGWARWVR